MENKISAGDVWWNVKSNYCKLVVQVESSMPHITTTYLMHNKECGHSSDYMWHSGGLDDLKTATPSKDWKFLFNIHDATTVALQAFKEHDEEHST